MNILNHLKLFYFLKMTLAILIFCNVSYANNKTDCKNSAYYVENVKSRANNNNLKDAKLKAEEIGRSKAFSKLLSNSSKRIKIMIIGLIRNFQI